MTWVVWRLQRTEMLIALGILALLVSLLLIPTGIQMANAYHQDGLAGCLSINPSKPVLCGNELGDFQQRFQTLTTLANWFTLIPGLIGVLLAAPFIFDLENGTYRLAWTQSITRGRWLLGKLGLPVVGCSPRCRRADPAVHLVAAHPMSTSTDASTPATTTPPAPSSSATRCSPWPSP